MKVQPMNNLQPPYDCDLAVIGAGSGGMAAARRAAQAGLSVIIFDGGDVGGTCVNRGCVPKKLLVHASRAADVLAELPSLGWSAKAPTFDWPTLRGSVEAETKRLSGYHATRLEELGIELVRSDAWLEGPQQVASELGSISAEKIIIATGARPVMPTLDGAEHCLVSDDLFSLDVLPERMAIVGGGYIAVEFACLLHRLGVEMTVLERGDRLINGFDADVAGLLLTSMREKGIDVRLDASVDAVSRADELDGELTLSGTDLPDRTYGEVLLAVGRHPNTESLRLEEHGIDTDERGHIVVDASGRTAMPSVFAIGDVTATLALTPVAVREARRSVDIILQDDWPLPVAGHVPTAAFTTPECASVGLREEDAHELGIDYQVRRSTFQPLAGLLSEDSPEIFMKALVDTRSRHLLGFHFFGPHASEAAQMGAVALAAGLSEMQLHHTMALHPTTAEEVLGLGRADEPLHQKAA